MEELNKQDLDVLAKEGQLSPPDIKVLLESLFYKSKSEWVSFLKLLFLSLGSGLMCAGVIFFFAFNWDELHKFVKLVIAIVLLLGSILPVLFLRLKPLYSNILLTVSSVLVGVSFSIYGQIYQTGADAFDFFLAWSIFVALWAFSTRFAPIWVVFLTLTTLTISLYFDQMHSYREEDLLMLVLSAKFTGIYFTIRGVEHYKKQDVFPLWFDHLLQLTTVIIFTAAAQWSIFASYDWIYGLPTAILGIGFGFYLFNRGLKQKNILSVSIIPFSLMWILSVFLIDVSLEIPMVLLLVVLNATFMVVFIKQLLNLLNQWKNENA